MVVHKYGEASEGRKRWVPRKVVWDSTLDIAKNPPVDRALLDAMIYEQEQEERELIERLDRLREESALSPGRPSSALRLRDDSTLSSGLPLPGPRPREDTPAVPSRPSSAPAGRQFSQAASIGSSPPARNLQRPQSAPSFGRSQRQLAVSRPKQGARPMRPQSAPRLLDNEGLIEKMPHRDSFLQNVENLSVKEHIQRFKRETKAEKQAVAHIDIMHDTSLFDLKILHNLNARKRTAKLRADSPKRTTEATKGKDGKNAPATHRIGPRHPKWKDISVSDQMRNLGYVLDVEMKLHMTRDWDYTDTFDNTMQPQNCDLPGEYKKRGKASPLYSSGPGSTNPELNRIAVNILEFLLEKCKSLNGFLDVVDAHGRGAVTKKEFEVALMGLGYVSRENDSARFFKSIDIDQRGWLDCDELFEALEAIAPLLMQKKMQDRTGKPSAGYPGKGGSPLRARQPTKNAKLDVPQYNPSPATSEYSQGSVF